ncbi:hypothetical protein H8S95_01760 [Pontibacter sp. KCTC 32443]|uniref:hypothetical protein n=1 Tax=Pontibacter TaxID=323449 RepID=UPI00164DDF66|nr:MULTISPECIES: hypothetical protein [Pontibacter]MBC5772775.1 hypothetical protein [Pontibacter sp. KCTC 32443]
MEFIEYLIIGVIISLQVYIAYNYIYLKIINLKSVFLKTDDAIIRIGDVPVSMIEDGGLDDIKEHLKTNTYTSLDEKIVEVALVDYPAITEAEQQIFDDINNYLVNNKGSVADYHLLKDIVDRNIDSLDEEINNSMPAPLYLGLAATMLGIILGLYQMDASAGAASIDNMLTSILGSVKIAMIASAIGLGLTTALSIFFYRPAKSEAEKNKNKFLSFLQVNLLPELIRTETSGISALNDRLKGFANTLNPAIKELSAVMDKSFEAIKVQERTMAMVEQLDTAKMAKANVTVFKELSKMMESFHEFANYYQTLNHSMVQTVELTNNLKALVSRTVEVERIAAGIDATFSQNKDLNQFLASHLIEFTNHGNALNVVVDSAQRNVTESINVMKEAVEQKIREVQEITIEMEPQLKDAFEYAIESVETMTKEQVMQLDQAFTEARPKFEQLDKLEGIDDGLQLLAEQGKESSEKQELMLQALKDLATALKENSKKATQETNINDDFLNEFRVLNKHLTSNGAQTKQKNYKAVTALLALNTTGFLGLAGFLIYAIIKGMIQF